MKGGWEPGQPRLLSDHAHAVSDISSVRLFWIVGIFGMALSGSLLPFLLTRRLSLRGDRAVAMCTAFTGELKRGIVDCFWGYGMCSEFGIDNTILCGYD